MGGCTVKKIMGSGVHYFLEDSYHWMCHIFGDHIVWGFSVQVSISVPLIVCSSWNVPNKKACTQSSHIWLGPSVSVLALKWLLRQIYKCENSMVYHNNLYHFFIHKNINIKGTVTQNIFSLKTSHIGCIDLWNYISIQKLP